MRIDIRISSLVSFQSALSACDGYNFVTKDGAVIRKNFKFSKETRLAIMRNIRNVKIAMEQYEEERNALILSLADDGGGEVSAANTGEFAKQHAEMLKKMTNVDINFIEESDLNIEDNLELSNSAVAYLAPMINRTTPAKE